MATYRFNVPFSMSIDTGFFLREQTNTEDLLIIRDGADVDVDGIFTETSFVGDFNIRFNDRVDGDILSAFRTLQVPDDQQISTVFVGSNLNVDASDVFDSIAFGDPLAVWSALTSGDDNITGSTGGDDLRGFAGDDRILGDAGADALSGGAGEDLLRGGFGADTLRGGADDDRLRGGADDDLVVGGLGDDNAGGRSGDDVVRGNAGDDMVIGNRGDDTLRGGAGDDTLRGGQDDDNLKGGDGTDVFVFNRDNGNDVIGDFADGVDMIQIIGGGAFGDLAIAQSGDDVVVTYDATQITISDADVGDITAADFIF